MFENIISFFKKIGKKDENKQSQENSKNAAKERLHLVLMQDRANVSADFLDLMKQEIIEVIKKYIDVDENSIDVRLTNKTNGDGTSGAPALYANIPIVSIKEDIKNKIARENDEKAQHIIPDNNVESAKNEEDAKQDNNEENKSVEQPVTESNITEEVKTESGQETTNNQVVQNVQEISENKEVSQNQENVNNEQGDTCEEQNS